MCLALEAASFRSSVVHSRSPVFTALKSGGILVTYCAKGDVRRTMQKVGFRVQKLPGPPGKREMLRGLKP